MALLKNETKIKLLWYLLLSAIGVFHAEVLSWSIPDVLCNPFNFLFIRRARRPPALVGGGIALPPWPSLDSFLPLTQLSPTPHEPLRSPRGTSSLCTVQ